MARGLNQHRERQEAVARLGRTLSRRASNRCELCEDSAALKVVEVEPVLEDPDEDAAVLVCERCIRGMAGGRGAPDPGELRFLEGTAWSEVVPVQVAAVRVVRTLADGGVPWAVDLLDGLYLSDDTQTRLG